MAFHDVVFPARLAFGMSGGPERQIDIVQLASGVEQRNARHSQARRRYALPANTRPLDELRLLTQFFEARGGPLHGFRFRDPVEHSTGIGVPISPYDVSLGIGDGQTTIFQLRLSSERRITRPVRASMMVAVNGTPVALGAGVSLDADTGQLTFDVPPANGETITAGFEFQVPVRFETAQLAITFSSHDAGDHGEISLVELAE